MSMIQVALFLMVVVFIVLFGVCLLIKLFSFIINRIESHLKQKN
ncbi:MAG: OadG family protein [Lachnospiraceae bacterium]